VAAWLFLSPQGFRGIHSRKIVNQTWRGYKKFFIAENSRTIRPKDGDTVSEGQSYAMLRAVLAGDKKTFDECYYWSESNLSRLKKYGDNLLAWRWKSGEVIDWMPASDADVDYALSLIMAQDRWPQGPQANVENYGRKASMVLNDILEKETYSLADGRLYLSPWILEKNINTKRFPVNPSYYSPAHFRKFYEYTGDKRWLELVDTAYDVLFALLNEFNGKKGKGLIPDWCSMDENGIFYATEGRSSDFGWEAVRIPFRVGLDYVWYGSREAKKFFNSSFSEFIKQEWLGSQKLFCEYNYQGVPIKKYESPLFYAAYYWTLDIYGFPQAQELLEKTREYIKQYPEGWVYQNKKEYYANSLSWLGEALKSGLLKNSYTKNKLYAGKE